MFRTQQNPFDDIVAKATDENLTSENWEYMMDAWERVNESGENGPRDVTAAMIKRLAHRNANVQLYTLELAYALSQNCGRKMHRELASRSFTDSLLRLVGDRSTHQTVKTKILEKMSDWTEMFSEDPDLGIMEHAYRTLQSQNPNLQPPSKPHKREITDADRLKEEEELQMALAISLKERQPTAGPSRTNPQAGSSNQPQSQPQQPAQSQPQPAPPITAPQTTAATVSRVRALYDFLPTEADELAFKKGDIIVVLDSVYKDWWKGSLRGKVGIFPLNYVERLSDPTPEELRREAETEAEVFAQIKNVEKLLALLSTTSPDTNVQESEEITALYHSTLAIRPKLIELIGKYSQKKDEFVALNEKFIKARRDYETLLESSMAQPPVGHYVRPPPQPQPSYPPHGEGYAPPGGKLKNYYPPQATPSPHIPQAVYQQPPTGPPPPGPPYPSQSSQVPNRRRSSQPYTNIPDAPPEPQPAPFYVVGHNTYPNAQQPPAEYPPTPRPPAEYPPEYPPTSQPPAAVPHPRPTSVSHHNNVDPQSQPHELATSIYDSPLNDRPPQVNQLNPQTSAQNSRIPDPGRISPSYTTAPSGYYSYPGAPSGSGAPQLSTSNIPTSLQPANNDITPVSPPVGHAYPAPYPAEGYNLPTTRPPAPPQPPEQIGGPADYYRQSNNELFFNTRSQF